MHILLLLHLSFVSKWRILIRLHRCGKEDILLGDINSVCIELHKVPLKQINREYTNDTILLSLKGLEFDSWSMFLEFIWFWPQMKAVTVKIMNSIWHRLFVLFILLISNLHSCLILKFSYPHMKFLIILDFVWFRLFNIWNWFVLRRLNSGFCKE